MNISPFKQSCNTTSNTTTSETKEKNLDYNLCLKKLGKK